MGDVLVAVNKYICKVQAAALSDSGDDMVHSLRCPGQIDSANTRDPIPSRKSEMYLQVQLKSKAGKFDLVPEVFLPNPDEVGWLQCHDADPMPCHGVPESDLINVINSLCKQAQRALPQGSADLIDQLVIELILPGEVLADLLAEGQSGISDLASLRETFSKLNSLDWPYLLRSLERAADSHEASVKTNRIRTHWQHAHGNQSALLACSSWPMGHGSAVEIASNSSQFKEALREPEGPVSALVSILSCPSEPKHTGEVLKAIFDSPLPVVLLWRKDDAHPALRWARASDLLERALPALPSAALQSNSCQDGCSFHPLMISPGAWCSRAAAQIRSRLLARKQMWVNQAVLLVDCPERWPRKIIPTSPDASTRYQMRSRTRS